MHRPRTPILALLSFIALAQLASAASCNATTPCPASAPCCSEYGFCGTGSYCLGGCEPNCELSAGNVAYATMLMPVSYMPESCLPNPICQNSESTFYNLDKVQVNGSLYDGNATAYDWVGELLRSLLELGSADYSQQWRSDRYRRRNSTAAEAGQQCAQCFD